jgi:NMD protein affecting ribosome stability and mRNA decay
VIAISTSPHATAEWLCSRCGSTNRKFVGAGTTQTVDRCVSCHAKHEVTKGARPVRWDAKPL